MRRSKLLITRRALLASLAAVAAAAVVPALTAREAYFVAEHRWVMQGLLLAVKTKDFSAWFWGGEEEERPFRWRLARALVTLRELDAPSLLEKRLLAEIEYFWGELTCPRQQAGFRLKL